MRRALAEALYVARNRRAFGKRLIDMPLMQRQLAKMLVSAEQARSVMFQTAVALAQADKGDAQARTLARIMTPLIKFRACRDARKVTGDAMEVRGGCGYIEEWVEPRLMRDAHLGSIWEGTSNIVALDVMRAIRKNQCLPALRALVERLLAEGEACPRALRDLQRDSLEKVWTLAETAAAEDNSPLTRQAASALYNTLSLAAMRWEARQLAWLPATRLPISYCCTNWLPATHALCRRYGSTLPRCSRIPPEARTKSINRRET
jgi:hypothetical protein